MHKLAAILDLRTIILVSCIVYFSCTLLVLQLWRQNRRNFDGLGLLSLCYVFQTLGLFVLVVRGLIPEGLSVVFSNLLMVGGVILGYRGFTTFAGNRQSLVMWAVMFIMFLLAQSYWYFIMPDLMWRKINSSMIMVVVGSLVAYFMFFMVDKTMRRFTGVVGWAHVIYAGFFTVRLVIAWLEQRRKGSFFDVNSMESVLALAYPALFVNMTYAVSLMINARLVWQAECAVDAREEEQAKVKVLRGLLPICAHCKKVRDDRGYWNQIEAYIKTHSEAEFSHGYCPECEKRYYSEYL